MTTSDIHPREQLTDMLMNHRRQHHMMLFTTRQLIRQADDTRQAARRWYNGEIDITTKGIFAL